MMYNEEEYKKEYADCEFMAPVTASEKPGKVYIDFPAESQHLTGVYKLVIVAKIYEPGYAPNDLRTVTMDYNDVLMLVGSSEDGESGNVYISVGNIKQATSVNIVGTTAVQINGRGHLDANVLPADIDDDSVIWEYVNEEDKQYLVTLIEKETSLDFMAVGLPDGVDEHQVVIKATSKKTPTVSDTIVVTIAREFAIDKYVESVTRSTNEGNAEDNTLRTYLDLNIAGLPGQPTRIDTTPMTVWYEGD